MNTRYPTLFVSHGAPLFAIDPGLAGQQLTELNRELPKPDAIVILSPHWMTQSEIKVTASTLPKTVHDFGGFPDKLYEIEYPAPGAPELAAHIVGLLQAAGWKSEVDGNRGFDHGAWIPLLYLAPEAEIPVIQISMPVTLNTYSAWQLGQALRPLSEMNIFVIGSGSLTHNLREFRANATHEAAYVRDFAHWTAERLIEADTVSLLDYRNCAPEVERAHPTDDHFLPLLVAMGAAGSGYKARVLPGGVVYGVLAMDSYLFTSAVS